MVMDQRHAKLPVLVSAAIATLIALPAWPASPSMYYARAGHTSTLLGNGTVLIAGGESNPSAELYYPASNTFTVTGDMLFSRSGHTATKLKTGQVLVAGGTALTATVELYNPATGLFSNGGTM